MKSDLTAQDGKVESGFSDVSSVLQCDYFHSALNDFSYC